MHWEKVIQKIEQRLLMHSVLAPIESINWHPYQCLYFLRKISWRILGIMALSHKDIWRIMLLHKYWRTNDWYIYSWWWLVTALDQVGKKSFKWGDIIDEYAQFIKIQGHCATNIVVVFDGCQSSTKDHIHHMHRQKQFCNQIKIVGKTHHIQQKKNTSLMAVTKLSFFFI